MELVMNKNALNIDINRFDGKISNYCDLLMLARPNYDRIQHKVVALVKAEVGTKKAVVLDLGCGYGYASQLLKQNCPALRCLAIDNEPKTIRVAREHLESMGIEVLLDEAVNFLDRCPEGSFDVIFSIFAIHNLEHKARETLVRSVGRVLKKGGLFIEADKIAVDDEARHLTELAKSLAYAGDVLISLGRFDLYKEWVNHYHNDNHPDLVYREVEVVGLLKRAGFVHVRREDRRGIDAVFTARKGK
jgi:SAM-dependent methyltransferase